MDKVFVRSHLQGGCFRILGNRGKNAMNDMRPWTKLRIYRSLHSVHNVGIVNFEKLKNGATEALKHRLVHLLMISSQPLLVLDPPSPVEARKSGICCVWFSLSLLLRLSHQEMFSRKGRARASISPPAHMGSSHFWPNFKSFSKSILRRDLNRGWHIYH